MGVTVFDAALTEGSSSVYGCTFVDADGNGINSGAITAITATLRDEASGAIVNTRNGQNVLNQNGGTLGTGGDFSLALTAADLAIQAGGLEVQLRRLVLTVTYDAGTIVHQVVFGVRDTDR